MRVFTLSLIVIITLFQCKLYAQQSIADARSMGEGEEVIVEGIVTNGSELGIIRYVQDNTAGLAIYPGSGSVGDFPGEVQRGDIVRVRGPLKSFNGLLEIDPVLEYTILSSGNTLPAPLMITPNDIEEELEGQLVQLIDVTFEEGGSVFGVGNYSFSSNGQESEIYIRSNHPLIGSDIPLANVQLTGIVSQFNSIYQLLPRDSDDILVVDNFFLTSAPEQSNLTTSGFTVRWTTNVPANSIVRYGLTPNLGEELVVDEMKTEHEIVLASLEPGEFYYVQIASSNGNSEIQGPLEYYATASLSSGEMRIYFNHHVNANVSEGHYPNGTSSAEIERVLIDAIDSAENSIDVAAYNINRRTIVDALTRAYDRGVQVRYIADNETANLALSNPTPPFSILRGNSEGLMHNKFIIIDAADVDKSWLVSGSMNFTEQNIARDYNNMILIQDYSLCQAYRIEFEEMWGSVGDFPGIFNVRFGSSKEDNTPHLFSVGGVAIESYFSPSDNTTTQIAREIEEAKDMVSFALLTFTNNTLGSAVLDAHRRSLDVRGIIDNISDTGSEYDYLQANGVEVSQDFTSKQTHHKYCILDAFPGADDPIIITGSHNWSASAETRNDENTLIIHDAIASNVFLQEFEARWCEVMGGANCTSSSDLIILDPNGVIKVYPIPSQNFISLELQSDIKGRAAFEIIDPSGRLLELRILNDLHRGQKLNFNIAHLPSAHYFLRMIDGNKLYVIKFAKI